MNFKDKVFLITGSTSGIGQGIAKALLEEGAKVVINYAHNEKNAEETNLLLEKYNDITLFVKAYISEEKSVIDMYKKIEDKFKKLDGLVNNAVYDKIFSIEELTVEEYKMLVRDSLVSDKKSEAEQTNQETLWNKIMDNATQLKDFSEADIKKEVSNIKIENKEMAGYFGMSVSDFIEQYYEMSLEDYAKENLKKQCVQDLLLKENSIEITDADVDEEIQYYIDELGYKDKKEVLSAISEDEIHSELQYTKLMDALMKETTIK